MDTENGTGGGEAGRFSDTNRSWAWIFGIVVFVTLAWMIGIVFRG